MKKVLVTGAAGCLGKQVIKYLLSEGKYDITVVDLKIKNVHRVLKKYTKRLNIIYGDITDPILMDELVKNNDYIIHLASIKPTLSSLKEKISNEIDYKGTENIVRAITFYNPKCFLIFPSTTNLYGNRIKEVTVSEKTNINERDYYTLTKYKLEKLIKEKLSNYVIFRIPTILCDLNNSDFIYNTPIKNKTEFISYNDAAYALTKSIDKKSEINKKVYNLGGGKNCIAIYGDVLARILEIYGINNKFIWSQLFLEKNMYGNVYSDSEKIEEILHYQNDSIDSYMMELKRKTKIKRFINIYIGKIYAKNLRKKLSKM